MFIIPRAYVPTYLSTYLPTYLPTYMHACMHACMHAYILRQDMLYMLSDQQERVLGKTEQALARADQQQEQALAKAIRAP